MLSESLIDLYLSISLQGLLGIVELTVLQSVKQDAALVPSLPALQLYVVHCAFSLFYIEEGRLYNY